MLPFALYNGSLFITRCMVGSAMGLQPPDRTRGARADIAVTRTEHPQDTCSQRSRVFRLSPLHYYTFILFTPLMPPMALFA